MTDSWRSDRALTDEELDKLARGELSPTDFEQPGIHAGENTVPSYFYVNEMVACTTLRAASVSMAESLGYENTISQAAAYAHKLDGKDVVMWVREPFDRLASVYTKMGESDFPEFVDYILEHDNPHWLPQTQIHTYRRKPLPNWWIPFEILRNSWDIIFPLNPLPLRNQSPGRKQWPELCDQLNIRRLAQLHEYYEEDLKVYGAITS